MKNLFFFMCLSLPALACGQSAQAAFVPASIEAKGSFFALSVPDLDASAKWYTEKLGLKVVMQVPKGKNKVAMTVLSGGGLIVELIQNDEAVPLSQAAPAIKDRFLVQGIFKVGIIVDDLDQTIAGFKAHNVPVFMGPWPASETGMRNLIIKDNNGNLIQFFGRK